MARQFKIIRHSALANEFDFVLSFNRNSDHLRYRQYYESIGLKRISTLPIGKRVLITTVGAKEFLAGLLLKFLGNTVTHIIHDFDPHPGRKRKITLAYNFLATRIFHVAFHSFNQAFRFSGSCSVFLLPIQLSTPLKDSLKPQSANGKYVLLAFGRNEPYKNFGFLNVLAKEACSKIRLVAAGEGVSQEISESSVEVHEGYISDSDLDDLIRMSSIVILPYTSGTQSGVIVKAFENCRPCAVSTESSLYEYIVGNELGLEFSLSDDPRAIANGIETFLASWNAETMRQQLLDLEARWMNLGIE